MWIIVIIIIIAVIILFETESVLSFTHDIAWA